MTRIDWGSITVPSSLLRRIDRLAKAENVPRHVIVAKALSVYMGQTKNVGGTSYLKGRRHSRGMWYGWKLLLSYAEFRISVKYRRSIPYTVREKMLKFFEGTLWQIMTRLKAVSKEESKEILKLAKEWNETQSNEILYRLNDKVREIFYRVLGAR